MNKTTNTHYKMYKSGKFWICSSLVASMLLTSGIQYANADTTSAINQTQSKVTATSGALIDLSTSGLGTASNPVTGANSTVFSFSLSTVAGKNSLTKGDKITLNIPSDAINYSTVGLTGASQYFDISTDSSTGTITLTAKSDLTSTTASPIEFSVYGNPLDIDGNDNLRTYDISATYSTVSGQNTALLPDNTQYYVKTQHGGSWNLLGSGVYPSTVWDALSSSKYHNNYAGDAGDNTGNYVYNQDAMQFTSGYFNTSDQDYSNGVLYVHSDHVIDSETLVVSVGSIGNYSEDKNPDVTWDADGKGFTLKIGNLSHTGNTSVATTFFAKTASNTDVVNVTSQLTANDQTGAQVSQQGSAKGKFIPTSNGEFAPFITAQDKTIYTTDTFTDSDILKLASAQDQNDGDISNKITIADKGGFNSKVPGVYTIKYQVTNSTGNTSQATGKITVIENSAAIDAKDSTLIAGPNTKWSAEDNFISATDQDGNPVDFKNVKVDGSVDTTKAGKYQITYSFTDASGNVVSKTITVTVVDSKAAIDAKDSTLIAGPNTKWSAEDNFISATDQDGSPVDFKNVKVDGSVDTTKAGKYQITYSFTDASGNVVSKTITVTVVDSKAAIDAKDSTLIAGPNTKWSAEDNFISATDQDGNPVDFKNVKVDGSVDTTKAGKYQITYSFTDASGNVVSKTITVTVVDSKAAIDAKDSTLIAGPNTKWSAEDNFISATDQDGNPVDFKNVKVDGSVDTTKAGKYQITYSFTDASGNVVSKTITVTVVDSSNNNTDDNGSNDSHNRDTTDSNSSSKNIIKQLINNVLPHTGVELVSISSILAAILALATGVFLLKKRNHKD